MDLFGRKKKAPPPARPQDAIQQLREAQTMLEKREKFIEKQAAQCRDDAKAKLRNKDKRGALFLIKRAKLYEQQVAQIYGKRGNLDVQIMALEGAASNTEIFRAMNTGRQALKAATTQVDVDAVSDVMEDINESIQMNEEINDALAQQIGPQMDEEELNAELEEMEQQINDSELLSVKELPAAPVTAKAKEREEKAPATTVPAVPQRTLVTAGGGTTVVSSSSSSSGGGGSSGTSAPKRHVAVVDDKEARELKELEQMMGM